MNLRTVAHSLLPEAIITWYKTTRAKGEMETFRFHSKAPSDIKRDIQEKYGHDSELLDLFAHHKGAVVHKWHHYIPFYDRYFSSFRGRAIRFLEIGVGGGGSLQMWRKYFGAQAIIFGIDIDPRCEAVNGPAAQVRIGSQTDYSFLESVVQEMGGVDIILDDGSHHMEHIAATLKYLFPRLSYGGVYMIEDLHAAYWRRFGGGYGSKKNVFVLAMDVIHDMHHWYHTHKIKQAAISGDCSGIHVHDSILVLEKNRVCKPVHSRVGEGA